MHSRFNSKWQQKQKHRLEDTPFFPATNVFCGSFRSVTFFVCFLAIVSMIVNHFFFGIVRTCTCACECHLIIFVFEFQFVLIVTCFHPNDSCCRFRCSRFACTQYVGIFVINRFYQRDILAEKETRTID